MNELFNFLILLTVGGIVTFTYFMLGIMVRESKVMVLEEVNKTIDLSND